MSAFAIKLKQEEFRSFDEILKLVTDFENGILVQDKSQ